MLFREELGSQWSFRTTACIRCNALLVWHHVGKHAPVKKNKGEYYGINPSIIKLYGFNVSQPYMKSYSQLTTFTRLMERDISYLSFEILNPIISAWERGCNRWENASIRPLDGDPACRSMAYGAVHARGEEACMVHVRGNGLLHVSHGPRLVSCVVHMQFTCVLGCFSGFMHSKHGGHDSKGVSEFFYILK